MHRLLAVLAEERFVVRSLVRLGQEMPLHAASAARALLAYCDRTEASALLAGHPLKPYTDATPTGVDEVLAHLDLVRARGYDVCDDELDHDMWTVAAPVHGVDGTVCASVTMAAPAAHLPGRADRDHARAVVLATAAGVSGDLGDRADEARSETETPHTGSTIERRSFGHSMDGKSRPLPSPPPPRP